MSKAQLMRPLDNIESAASASGASAWWSAGHIGGRGGADAPANLAIVQDSMYQPHPAFQGITFENRPGYVQEAPNSGINGHGTAVLSMAASQGPTGCALCQPADVQQKGTGYGVSKIVNPDGAMSEIDWAAGRSYGYYDASASSWVVQAGARDPAQVMSFSRGADTLEDDTADARTWDEAVDVYGTTVSVAAGNSGPAAQSVNDPALAYNVIAAGAYCCSSSGDHTTDAVFSWSSRGPTAAGRKKPDLVAPGSGNLADVLYATTGSLWKSASGTSFAAPQIAAGATLLAGAGIRDPKVVKALLINSARLGRNAPGAAWGTQTGWQADFGWGEMDLDTAYQQRLNFDATAVPANSARFYRATAQGAGDRATLVWNRRVDACAILRTGCVYGDPSYHVYTLSNLDLTAYSASTGAQQSTSNSAIDNVEQVRTTGAGNVIYKVAAGGVDGHGGEPFALAATRPLTPLATPQPTVALSSSAVGAVAPGQSVTLNATVANPSDDLTAPSTQLTLNLPPGVELVAGQQSQSLGTLAQHGTSGSTASASWTVRGNTDGLKQLTATATATVYGSPLTGTGTTNLTVDGTPPQPTLAAPVGTSESEALAVSWGAPDGASYDVEVSLNDAPYVTWLTATTATSATYYGSRGNGYRFRVRARDSLGNTSAFVTSPEVQIATAARPDDPTPGRDLPHTAGANLALKRTVRKGATVMISGTIHREATGRVTIVLKAGGSSARAAARPRNGAFQVRLLLPRAARRVARSTLTVKYPGDARFAPQIKRLALRLR